MAESVVEGDDRVDELYHQIDDRLLLILATQSPVAVDLRAVVTMMRINHELERDADLMVNVAKTTRRIYPHELDPKVRGIIDRMGVQSSNQTRLAIDAFADSDPSWAAALSDMDDTMDELTKSLFRHILAWGASDEATVLQAVQVALVGPSLRADRRPRGHHRRAGPVHGHRYAPRRRRTRQLGRSERTNRPVRAAGCASTPPRTCRCSGDGPDPPLARRRRHARNAPRAVGRAPARVEPGRAVLHPARPSRRRRRHRRSWHW